MLRRKFLTLIGVGGLAGMGFLLNRKFVPKWVKEPAKSALNSMKPIVNLPPGGESISVETALNSRCTSDSDANPEKFHWGMFNKKKRLSSKQIDDLAKLARIPRFSDKGVAVQADGSYLLFKIKKPLSDNIYESVMVESGMLQQAICLLCASFGVGMVFKNLGKDGKALSDTELGTIKIRLGAMNPGYDGSFWTKLPPSGTSAWKKGNLPDPVRDGDNTLLSILAELKIENEGQYKASERSISQLLWAARGRTPHFYASKPWGMTIPTWAGRQKITNMCFVNKDRIYQYQNWVDDRPTHSMIELEKPDVDVLRKLTEHFPSHSGYIILGKNEEFARSLWEIGYQLLNLMLQAKTLDIKYKASILTEKQKTIIELLGVKNPVAILSI